MTVSDLSAVYRSYIDCLNGQDWTQLHRFVRDTVIYNGQDFGIRKYRQMLERDFADIPDLRFSVRLLYRTRPTSPAGSASTARRKDDS